MDLFCRVAAPGLLHHALTMIIGIVGRVITYRQTMPCKDAEATQVRGRRVGTRALQQKTTIGLSQKKLRNLAKQK